MGELDDSTKKHLELVIEGHYTNICFTMFEIKDWHPYIEIRVDPISGFVLAKRDIEAVLCYDFSGMWRLSNKDTLLFLHAARKLQKYENVIVLCTYWSGNSRDFLGDLLRRELCQLGRGDLRPYITDTPSELNGIDPRTTALVTTQYFDEVYKDSYLYRFDTTIAY
jgi:hypothetical protein